MTSKVLTIIEKDGKVAKDKDPNLSGEELVKLYQTMVRTRVLDERGLALQRQGRIGFYLQCIGQEASHIGSTYALRDSDWVFPSYRQLGSMLLRGARLDNLLCELFGNEGDTCLGRQMPVHYSYRAINVMSISSPIGTQLSQATGAAMAARIRREDTVILAYLGDGATSSNDFHAGLNFAGVFKAPVVFVCENNQWAISLPVDKQTRSETIAAKAQAYGIPGVRVDGNDILAVYRVCLEAVDRARKGEGPTLVETLTYRMGSHSSSDDANRYRDKKEVEHWAKRDPILRFQRYLKLKGLWSEALEQETRDGAKNSIGEAIKIAEARAKPAPETMFEGVFMNTTSQLREQRDELLSLEGPESDEQGVFPL